MKIDELNNRLEDEFPNIYNTILINGNWGIGKTHFIKKEFLKYKNPMYLSLFGINSFEEFKIQLYMELNKVLGFLNKKNKDIEGMNIGLCGFSLSIPYFEKDIVNKIEKKSKKKDIIIVIDDIERKNDNINIESVLGLIESVSKFKKVNIILIANEKEIPENDMPKYQSFKEKVIQKTYIIDEYSDTALESVINKIKLNKINTRLKVSLKKELKTFFKTHKIKNLRTVEKGMKFLNFIFNKIDIKNLTEAELYDISIMALAIVIEKIEHLYSKDIQSNEEKNEDKLNIERLVIEEKGELASCIIKNYFKEQITISIKFNIINPLLDIYEDKNINENINKIDNYYIYIKESADNQNKISEENMFYLSEENQQKIINNFYINSILKINPNLDINSWFKSFNHIYTNASRIDMQNVFKEDDVIKAMDLYLENLKIKEPLFYLLQKHIPFEFRSDKMKMYNQILNEKIKNKYYENYLKLVVEDVKGKKYNTENLEIIFSIYKEKDFTKKNVIIKEIEKNNYFIPNLNNDISEESWRFAHKIWHEMQYLKDNTDNKFECYIKELLKSPSITKVGKYRVNSLNLQYNINIENKKDNK